MSEGETPLEEMPFPLPPASFTFLIVSLRAQAEMHLGILPGMEAGEKPERNLIIARHTIDTLSVLLEKTKGNLTLEEQRLLENSLTELRFRFVQANEEESKTTAQKA